MGVLSGAIKYMKGKPGALIPAETKTGQLSMLPSGFGRIATSPRGVIGRGVGGRVSNPTPPFIKGRPVSGAHGMAAAKVAARREELVRKKAGKQRLPKKGEAMPYSARMHHVNTKAEQDVDDFFFPRG